MIDSKDIFLGLNMNNVNTQVSKFTNEYNIFNCKRLKKKSTNGDNAL